MSRRSNLIIGKWSPLPILPEDARHLIGAEGQARDIRACRRLRKPGTSPIISLIKPRQKVRLRRFSPGEAMMVHPVYFRMAGRR